MLVALSDTDMHSLHLCLPWERSSAHQVITLGNAAYVVQGAVLDALPWHGWLLLCLLFTYKFRSRIKFEE